MIDHTDGKLDLAMGYAIEICEDSLQDSIDRMKRYDNDERQLHVYSDRCLHSFYFEVQRNEDQRCTLNGGIIFHGPYDNGGSGGYPTFSVSLSNDLNPHWAIHT